MAKALYSASYTLVGRTLRARRDSATVKLYLNGELVKVHPRVAPGRRSTDPADFPPGKGIYATRDVESLTRVVAAHGPSVAAYAQAILDVALPWTKMRQVYRLIGLAEKWGSLRLDQACRRALDAEAVDVNLIARMLERARENKTPETGPDVEEDAVVVQGRFQRGPVRVLLDQGTGPMSAPAPAVSPELKTLMRKLKLGRLNDTLPEPLALAKSHGLSHARSPRTG